ncbi:hypothetical protein ACVWZ6_003263 [Bradyrhizobium sp. GM6.1]
MSITIAAVEVKSRCGREEIEQRNDDAGRDDRDDGWELPADDLDIGGERLLRRAFVLGVAAVDLRRRLIHLQHCAIPKSNPSNTQGLEVRHRGLCVSQSARTRKRPNARIARPQYNQNRFDAAQCAKPLPIHMKLNGRNAKRRDEAPL